MLLIPALFACSGDDLNNYSDYNPGGTNTQNMAGEWFVVTKKGDTKIVDYKKIMTYNTAMNDGKEMWVDDLGKIWDFKVKSPINYNSLTFAGNTLENTKYDITVNITNGKILKGVATTTGGNKSDSIYFEAEFSDDPGVVYTISGYKRTGFSEDEH